MKNCTIKKLHISGINAGDTVLHNGVIRTVSGKDLREDTLMEKQYLAIVITSDINKSRW